MADTTNDPNVRRRHDHICHAQARFAGDPPAGVDVCFNDAQELDRFICLLQDLRANAKLQTYHVHLQDYRMCDDIDEPMRPGDAEVMFRLPGSELDEDWEQQVADGTRAMERLMRRRRRRAQEAAR